jgi:predicted GIY-YIG superfamily endonuclease
MLPSVKGFSDYVTYVLLLEDGRYYVGLTKSLKKRLDQHLQSGQSFMPHFS